MNNPIFPPPFGQSSSSSSPKLKNKSSKDALSFTSGVHGGGHGSSSTRDHEQFDNRSLWRDNVSASSSNVQDRGGGKNFRDKYFYKNLKLSLNSKKIFPNLKSPFLN